MSSRGMSGNIRHAPREFSPGRPLHITQRVEDDVPNLRCPLVWQLTREAADRAQAHGVTVLVQTLMADHIHVFLKAPSREQLTDAMKVFFGHIARGINKLFGRCGPVFTDRYWSTLCKSVNQAWATVGYILRNPFKGGVLRRHRDGFDRYTALDVEQLASERFLSRCFAAPRKMLLRLLRQLVYEPLPFVPLANRLQLPLPGL